MPGIEFIASFNHDPFVKSANAILSSVKNMAAQVERAGGDMEAVMNGIFDGSKLGRGMDAFFNGIIENFGLSAQAADDFKKKATASIEAIANSSDDATLKISKITTEVARLVSEAKQADMSGLADSGSGKRSLEDMRTATAFLIDSLNEATDAADEFQEAFEKKRGKSIEDKIQDIENYENSLKEAKRVAEATYASQEEYIKGLREELAKLNENVNNSNDQSKINQWNQEAADLTNRLTDAEKVLEKIKDVSSDIDIRIDGLDKPKEKLQIYKDLKDELKSYGNIFDEIEFGTKEADKAFEEYANKTRSSTEQMKSNLKQIAQLAGIAFGLNEAKNFVENIVSVRTEFQDIESSMKVFLGNEEKASEFVNKLKDYAWYNMFEFRDLTKASQQMIAYGQDVDTIIPKLDMLSNVAAGTHAPLMEMVDAYNRAKSTGVVDAMGIKSWAVKGVVIKDVLREMGETAVGTSISFEQLNKVLEHITGEGGMFHDLMKEQLNNISAEKGQLEDNLANMYNDIGEKLQGAITKWYKIQSDMVDNYVDIAGGNETIDFVVNFVEHGFDELAENWKTLLDYVKNAIVLYGSWRVSLALIEPMRKATVWWTNAEATAHEINAGKIKLEAIAQGEATAGKVRALQVTKALNASILASPWTWAAVALTGLAYAVYSYYDNILTTDEAQRKVNSSIDEYKEKLKESQDTALEYINVIQNQTASLYEQYKAYKELIELFPSFAKFSPAEIQKMTPEMAKQIMSQDDAEKVENLLKNQIDALKEYYKWLESTKSGIYSAFNVIGAKENFEKIFSSFNIPKETIDKLWEDVGWNTNLKDFTNTLIDTTTNSLSETLSDKAKAGIINGFDEGLSDNSLKTKASEMIEQFSADVSKKTSELEKKIAELESIKESKGLGNAQEKMLQQYQDELDKINETITGKYQGQISQILKDTTANIEKLRKEYVVAPDSKKSEIELKLQTEQKTQEFLLGLMKFFEEGTTNKELIIEVTNKTDNIQMGDDFLIELGKKYENVDGIVSDYLGRLDQARASTEDLGAISIQQASEIAESYGLTAENVEEDFGNAETAISNDITRLRRKLDEDLTDDEKNKINLQITRKQEQLDYIQNLHKQMSQLVQNPYNIMVNIKTKIEEGIRKLLGLDTKTTETNTTETPSQKAQRERREAEERRKKEEEQTKQTGAQWKAKYDADKKQKIAELKAKLKTPLTQAEYDAITAQLNNLTKGADKAANAAKKKAKEAADQQAKSIQQQLKYNDDLQKLQDEAAEARSKAEIAAIRSDAERERAEREYQHKKTLEDIKKQQDEIYKKIYQDRKAAYENANKGKKYELTDSGKAGWQGVKEQMESATGIGSGVKLSLKDIGVADADIRSINSSTEAVNALAAAIDTLGKKKADVTVTAGIEQLGELELPKDGRFTITAEYDGSELDALKDIPKEAVVTVSTRLGDVKIPDIPKEADIEVTTTVNKKQYDALVKELGKDAVQVVNVETGKVDVPDFRKQKTVEVNFTTDAAKLDALKKQIPANATIAITTDNSEAVLPDIPKNASVKVSYETDERQIEATKDKLPKKATVTVEGKVDEAGLRKDMEKLKGIIPESLYTQLTILADTGKVDELRDKIIDLFAVIDNLNKNGKVNPDLNEILSLLENPAKIDASQLDDIQKKIDALDLSNVFTGKDADKEIAQWKLRVMSIFSTAATENANNTRQELEYQKQRIQSMRDYLKEYGSYEQKRLAITKEYEEKIKKAREAKNEGEALRLEQEEKKVVGKAKYEDIAKNIDWYSLFNGMGNMSKQMMQQVMGQLHSYVNTDEFRSSGAENQQKIAELMSGLREYIGTENGGMNNLAEAMVNFNSAIETFQKAQEEERRAMAAYTQAEAIQTAAKSQLNSGEITTEEFNRIDEELKKAKNNLDKASRVTVEAKESVQGFGAELNMATDAVTNYHSRLDILLKNSEGFLKNMPGFSELQSASAQLTQFGAQAEKAQGALKAERVKDVTAESSGISFNDGMGNALPIEMQDAMAKEFAMAENVGAEKILGGLEGITTDISSFIDGGLEEVLGSTVGPAVSAIIAIPRLILSVANAVKGFVTGILDSFTELLKFEWLSDLINSILDSLGNLVEAVFQIPAKLVGALGSIITNGVGGLLSSLANTITFGGFNSWTGSKDTRAEADAEIARSNEILSEIDKSVKTISEQMENSYGGTAISKYTDLLETYDKKVAQYNKQIQAAGGAYYDRGHTEWYYRNENGGKDSYMFVNGELRKVEGYVTRTRKLLDIEQGNYDTSWNEFFNQISTMGVEGAEKLNKLRTLAEEGDEEAAELWFQINNTGWDDEGRISKAANSLADLADSAKEAREQLQEILLTTNFDSIFDDFMSSLYDFADGSEDVMEDVADNWQKMVNRMIINNMVGQKLKEQLQTAFDAWSKEVETANNEQDEKKKREQLKAANEQFYGSYTDILQSGIDQVEQLRDMGIAAVGTESSKQQSATANSIQNISYDQADSLIGIELAKQMILEQMLAIMKDAEFKPEVKVPQMENAVRDVESIDTETIGSINDLISKTSDILAKNGLEALQDEIKQLEDRIPQHFYANDLLHPLDRQSFETEDGNNTRDIILENLQNMQNIFGGAFDEIRTLTIQANSTRESILKVMKERYESFDIKLTNIYKELQAQA